MTFVSSPMWLTHNAATVFDSLRSGAIEGPNNVLQASHKSDLRTTVLHERTEQFKMKFLGQTISLSCSSDVTDLQIPTHRALRFLYSLHGRNVGEVQSSNYPISWLTVGYITDYALLLLTYSPSQSIYHT